MHVLTTVHFESGRLVRFEGTEPDGPAYDCRYVQGKLSAPSSVNAQRCPMEAAQIEEAAN
jgi:hypothetical protein